MQKKTRTVHPEENPKGFQEVYAAYMMAIRFAKETVIPENSTFEEMDIALTKGGIGKRTSDKKLTKEVINTNYEFEILYQKQRQRYQEKTIWIFDRLDRMMESEKYDDWHDEQLWQDIVSSKEFKEHKYQEEFINTLQKYIIGNDKIVDKYLDIIYKAYAFDRCHEENIDDFVYPMYLYLKDRLHRFLNVANTCTKRLWFFTLVSILFFWLRIDEIIVILLCSIIFVSKTLFYQIPKYKIVETSSKNIYQAIRWNYISALFQVGLQYTFCVLHFPEWNLMPITIEIVTIIIMVFSVFKKYKNPLVIEFYYQMLFLVLSAWSFFIGDLDQMIVLIVASNVSLLLVYGRWIREDIKVKMAKARMRQHSMTFGLHYILILPQYVLLLIRYFV